MSTWTHVVGCIRIDGLPQFNRGGKATVEQLLGPICTFEKWNDESTLPRGSEGGLQYQIIEYDKGLPWLAIPIWGDLRDYDSAEPIKKWWDETLAKFQIVRDGILRVAVEGQEPVILVFKRPG